MSISSYDILVLQGCSFDLIVTYTDDDSNPMDLTGSDIRMQVRQFVTDETSILDCSLTTGHITLTDAVNGVFTLGLDPATTDELSLKNGVYDIEVELASGKVYRILQGHFDVDLSVTREVI